ncbi:MAG: N-acetylmuramoyl-L-alanine amidase [Acidobacteriota bacterium]
MTVGMVWLLSYAVGAWPSARPDSFLIHLKDGRKVLPKVILQGRSYLPLTEFLELLDLPYAESASAGYLTTSPPGHQVRFQKDRSQVQVDGSTVVLSYPVWYDGGRWLVPPETVSRVLNRILPRKIDVSDGDSRFNLVGNFVPVSIKGSHVEQSSRIVIQFASPVDAEIQTGPSRIVVAFGSQGVEPSQDALGYKDAYVRGVSFEESETQNQLSIDLAQSGLQTKVTHFAAQNTYLLEVLPSGQPALVSSEGGLFGGRWVPGRKRMPWRHITIDPGHGGQDRGAEIKPDVFEKDVTLAIAQKVRWVLQTRLGVNSSLTRTGDETVSLEKRALTANTNQSDLFLSIHIGNWSHDRDSKSYVYVAKGLVQPDDPSPALSRVRFLPWTSAQAVALGSSIRLAGLFQGILNRELNAGDMSAGYREAPLLVLYPVPMPAVLVELGNVREPKFRETVTDDAFQNRVANIFLAAVSQFRTVQENP